MVKRATTLNGPYRAYERSERGGIDEELTRVGRTTPCGEYLRRFWQPVALSSELKDLPLAVRILGENLVLFRDGSGRIGLLDRHCPHRGTSLEFGKIQDRGIRCCYHGWQFDVDGRILDTPGEPANSPIKDRHCHGAYPTHEYEGIVFAYLGPPEAKPAFPIYDLFVRPGKRLVPAKVHSPCNWLQIRENEMDPVHITFLHTRLFGVQFVEVFGALPTMEWLETPVGMMYVTVRRWKDHLYLRSNDMILPNIARVAGLEDGEGETVFDRRSGTTNWVVPVDDTNSLTIGWDEHEENLPDPARDGYLDRRVRSGQPYMGPFDVGQTGEPTYEQRQRAPGDWDAWVSQGGITRHGWENLGLTDRGISMYRKLLRRGIRAVKRGEEPQGLVRTMNGPIETFSHNTVKRIPPAATDAEDRALSLAFGRKVTKALMSGALRGPSATALDLDP